MSARVKMHPKKEARPAWIGPDDVDVTIPKIRDAARINVDVDLDVLRGAGARAIEYAVEMAAARLVHERQSDIQRAVDAILLDRKWMELVIHAEISKAVQQVVIAMLAAPAAPPSEDRAGGETQRRRKLEHR